MKHITSFFDNEQTLIQSLLEIHNGGGKNIDLDPMYNKGMFYKAVVQKPHLRFDINASENGYDAQDGDATNLPLPDESVHCEILDPPFLFGIHGKQDKHSPLAKRYTMFKDFNALKELYIKILDEAYRVLKKNGILIFKCQDYTDGKTTMTHCWVWKWATDRGFYAKDIAILNKPQGKIYNGNLIQRHLRKTHCYFYVFVKK